MDINLKIGSTAFVASTLPISVLHYMVDDWQVKRIILSHQKFLLPYRHLQALHPNIIIDICPSSELGRMCFLLYQILISRLIKRSTIFFHECCWEFFDILILFIRPKGLYFPQVSLNSFKQISNTTKIKSGMIRLLRLTGILHYFNVYTKDRDGNCGEVSYFLSMKSYPRSIAIHSINFSRNIISQMKKKNNVVKTNKIIFLADRDNVSDNELTLVYLKIIQIAVSNNFDCYIKSHPNKVNHLCIEDNRVKILDHTIPIELINDDFRYAIGTGSTGLLHFGNRSISIIGVLSGMSKDNKNRRKAHLASIKGGEGIKFISSMNELEKYFNLNQQ